MIRLRSIPRRLPFRRASAFSSVAQPSPQLPDGLDRWPHPYSARGILRGLDWAGTFVFAASGSITAAACGLDALGAVAVGTITAVGGGSLRDVVILGREPFWSGIGGEVEYLYLAAAGALAAFVFHPIVGKDAWPDDTAADAVSLGAFAVIGAMNGARARLPFSLCVLSATMTATGGGVLRDIITRRPVRIFHSEKELYASCAAFGGGVFLLSRGRLPLAAASVLGVGATAAARAAAVSWNLRLRKW